MQIKQISPGDTIPIRHQILRPGKPVDTCHFRGDDSDQTFHLGAFKEGQLVSVASFFFNKSDKIQNPNQFQLRGMATLEQFQKKGYSRELLKVAFPIVKQNFCDTLWCNARVAAQPFYEKLGFSTIGGTFEIPDVGTHVLMYKDLS